MVRMRAWQAGLGGLALTLLAGCTAPARQPTAPIPPSTAPTNDAQPSASQAGPVRDLIDEAARLPFASERAVRLQQLAARSDLSAADQLALINAACQVGFSESVKAIFLTLARNPMLAPAGEAYLRQRLDCIPFSNHREEVLAALAPNARLD